MVARPLKGSATDAELPTVSLITGIIRPAFRFSGGVRAYTNVFQPVRPDA